MNAFKSHIESAVNGMTVGLGPISDVYVSCNEDSLYDPTPDGAWTDDIDGDGNRCADGLGNALGSTGDVVSVRVEYDYQTFTPLLQTFIGTVPLSASATMIIN